MKVEIYSKEQCPFCDKAKMRLAKYNPMVYKLNEDFNREEFFEKFPGARTFPQIVINGDNIGGYTDLEKTLGQYE